MSRCNFSFLLVLVVMGLVFSGCSDRVQDQLDFETQVRLACEASCKVTTQCDPSNLHYGSMESCMGPEGCPSWSLLQKPGECADAILEDKYCKAALSCEEFMLDQHGEVADRDAICRETSDRISFVCPDRG